MKWLRVALPIVAFPFGPLAAFLLITTGIGLAGGWSPVALVFAVLGFFAPSAFRMLGLAPFGARVLLSALLLVPLAGLLHLGAWALATVALLHDGVNFMGGHRFEWIDVVFAAGTWIVASTGAAILVGAIELVVLRDRRATPHVFFAHLTGITLGVALICGVIGPEAAGPEVGPWVAPVCGLVAAVAVIGTPWLSAACVLVLERNAPESV